MSQEKKLAIVLAEDLYEDLELHYPRLRLKEAGFDVLVAGPTKGATYKSKFGYWAKADVEFKEIDPAKVSVLVIPGGSLFIVFWALPH
jgi:protease I